MQHLEQEAQALRDQGEFDRALQVCEGVLSKHPKSPAFTTLRRDILLRRRQTVMELIRHVGIQLLSEPHIEKRLELIEHALNRFPNERFFKQSYAEAQQTLDEVRALASSAHLTAGEGQFEQALGILDTISGIYPEYPSLDADRKRITTLRENAKSARKKTRTVAAIRMALAKLDVEGTHRMLQTAFEEFPHDNELAQIQNELTGLENRTKEANSLYDDGRQQVAAEEYEAGIAMLRQASGLDSKSRRVEMALFNALVQFAKNIVDFEPKRAKHLLEEAAQLSPFNLTIETTAKYLSDRIRVCALDDCRMRVQILRDNGQIHEALKLATAVANEHDLHDDPALEQIRSDIWINFGIPSGSDPDAGDRNAHRGPKLEDRLEKRNELAPLPTVVLTETSKDTVAANGNSAEPRPIFTSLLERMQKAISAMDTWNVRARSRKTLRRIAVEGQSIRAKTLEWYKHLRGAFIRLPNAYKIVAAVICLLLVVATTVVSTSLRRQPDLNGVGTATMASPAPLFRDPSVSSPVSGTLKIGQSVEILTQLPAMTSDAWTLVRPVGDKQIYGYTRLQNLDRIRTTNPQFDVWHAMSILNRSSSPEELKTRLADVEQMLQTAPLPASRDTDALLLRLSKAFAGLAVGSKDDPKAAKAALVKSEAYLSRIAGTLQLSDEADEVKEAIHKTHLTLGDATAEPAALSPATRIRNEEARIMQLANNAYAQSTYEKAAEYSDQVLRLNNGNLEARKLLDAARRAQKDLEESIAGR
jgi:tetratricopeptide (TPR) repeat protein